MSAILTLLFAGLISGFAAESTPRVTATAETLINQRLTHIEIFIAQKKQTDAIQAALSMFNLNASNCRAIEARPITYKDDGGNDIVAHTQLDQTVVLDSKGLAFKSARFLVTMLAQQIAHCDQNQKLYSLALANDRALAALKDKVIYLRHLGDLDEIAGVALKNSPAKADAAKKFKQLAAKYGLTLTPEQLNKLSDQVAADLQNYQRTLAELNSMEGALKAFEVPGVLTPPAAGAKPSPEFLFNQTTLLLSTNAFLKSRQLFGSEGKAVCQVINYVPFALALQHERNCHEAIEFLKASTL